jgi:glycosyltransferase involved in cell wall biosynthesis
MTANASMEAIKSIVGRTQEKEKLNVLTFCTHERYEQNLCRTGHNFYSLKVGKIWNQNYGEIPENYHHVDDLPAGVELDLVLSHTSCERLQLAGQVAQRFNVPLLRHTHILPDIRMPVEPQIGGFSQSTLDCDSFISEFNKNAWYPKGSKNKTQVIEHGVDYDFWQEGVENVNRDDVCLSVVNLWPERDWCCGWELWKHTSQNLPVRVVGDSPGLSKPAESIEHLRKMYQSSSIFYNTSLHSPVPTVLLEAMAAGCAIVSTNTCMIPEVIQHGKNGLVSDDPSELRGFLESLLKDKDRARELGNNAAQTIKERYNLNRFIKSWDDHFKNTIKNYRR